MSELSTPFLSPNFSRQPAAAFVVSPQSICQPILLTADSSHKIIFLFDLLPPAVEQFYLKICAPGTEAFEVNKSVYSANQYRMKIIVYVLTLRANVVSYKLVKLMAQAVTESKYGDHSRPFTIHGDHS